MHSHGSEFKRIKTIQTLTTMTNVHENVEQEELSFIASGNAK